MVSKKELEYINLWAHKTPFPGVEYAKETLDELEKCVNLFYQEYYNRRYNIVFSNNEEIEFEILEKNLCHMLGIDYTNLKGEYFDLYRQDLLRMTSKIFPSFELLESIVANRDRIVADDDERCSNKAINYYKVAIKCAIFRKLADLSAFNYGCINFDKSLSEKLYPNITFRPNSTRLLYTPSDESVSPFCMMGLKNTLEDETYFVETLFMPIMPKTLFDGQEVVIPTQIITDDNGILRKKQATVEEKLKLLKDYQSFVIANNLPNCINIYGDYISMLMSKEKQEAKLILK